MFAPLIWWELVRLTRRGQVARLRILFLYTLFLALLGFAFVWAYPFRFSGYGDRHTTLLPAARVPQVAGLVALVLLEVQLLLVAMITPAYAVATLTEEKDRGTLSLLLTTQLTDSEIIWGKLIARVLLVLSVVLAGVPIVLITWLFGGADAQFLLAGYALTSGTTVLAAAIGIHAGSANTDSRTALVRAYAHTAAVVGGALIPPFVLLTPFAMLAYLRLGVNSEALRVVVGFGYPVGQVVVAVWLIGEAIRRLRGVGATSGPWAPTAFPEPPRGRAIPILNNHDREPEPLPPLDEANPILWKERYAGRVGPWPSLETPTRWMGAVFTLLAVALFVSGGWLLMKRAMRTLDPAEAVRLAQSAPGPPDTAGELLVSAGVIASLLYLLPLTVGVTGCVARERQRATLDSLLITTLPRNRILRSKVRAHVEHGLVFAGGAAAALVSGFAVDGGLQRGSAVLAAFIAGTILTIGLSAWLSVRLASPASAFRLVLPVVVAVVGLPAVVWYTSAWVEPRRAIGALVGLAVMAVGVGAAFWWRAGVELDRAA